MLVPSSDSHVAFVPHSSFMFVQLYQSGMEAGDRLVAESLTLPDKTKPVYAAEHIEKLAVVYIDLRQSVLKA